MLENKKKLNDSRNRHEGVFIHPDQSKEERHQRSALKIMIESMKNGTSKDLQLIGSRVVRERRKTGEYREFRNEHGDH